MRSRAVAQVIELFLKEKEPTRRKLQLIKIAVAGKHGITMLKNTEILPALKEKLGALPPARAKMIHQLVKLRPMRTISGVTPVAVMTPPSNCPHGTCIYCPRGENAAQSYTGFEPAALRGKQNAFDPYRQVENRLRQFREMGHVTDKCELILMGGTFIAQKPEAVEKFVARCYDAFNRAAGESYAPAGAFNDCESKSLDEAKKLNETSKSRVIGVTFETKPDYAKEKQVDLMLSCGATRVELGVQALSDSVYKRVNRGHTIEDVVEATRICKDSALKVCYHMMPGLFSTPKEDIGYFKTLFSDSRFQPDMLKIYPTLVIKGTGLYELWKQGKYTPYDTEQAAEVVAEATKHIPEYARVMRIQRDIPTQLIDAGVKKSNLRELVDAKLKEKGLKCRCIRCREIGLAGLKDGKMIDLNDAVLKKIEYDASNGREIFLEFAEPEEDVLIGFTRLRFPGKGKHHRKEITPETALIRELHVYGEEIGINRSYGLRVAGYETRDSIDPKWRAIDQQVDSRPMTLDRSGQHKGFGRKLLEEAEGIAADAGYEKLTVISGVGVREYYRKLGYVDDGVYVSKRI